MTPSLSGDSVSLLSACNAKKEEKEEKEEEGDWV